MSDGSTMRSAMSTIGRARPNVRTGVRTRSRRLRVLLVLTVCSASLGSILATAASAFPTRYSSDGAFDFTYGSSVRAGGAGTTAKPESKLFHTGGAGERIRWWAVLGTSGSGADAGVWLWRLEDHEWDAKVRLPRADPWAKADVLYEGRTLTISLRDDKSSSDGNPRESTLYTMRYRGRGRWTHVQGPTRITTAAVETLTIARDSLGRVWATYEEGGKIWVGYTGRSGTAFTFRVLSRSGVARDDVSSVTAFGGDRIGVFWSDQRAKRDMFAWRRDTDGVHAQWHYQTAYGGGVGGCPTGDSSLCADDHMNVKVYRDEIFVAIKTSLNDDSSSGSGDPLIVLLHRSGHGRWSSSTVSTVGQDATRPIVVLSPSTSRIWVWATRDGEVDVWQSSFRSPSFSSGRFVAWVSEAAANNATSTKQTTTAASGVVVEVSDAGVDEFWHNEFMRR